MNAVRVNAKSVAKEQRMKTTISKLRKDLRKIILETGRSTSIETDPLLAKAYEEGSEQGTHDRNEGLESEVLRYMFRSQEEYEAFLAGYEDALSG